MSATLLPVVSAHPKQARRAVCRRASACFLDIRSVHRAEVDRKAAFDVADASAGAFADLHAVADHGAGASGLEGDAEDRDVSHGAGDGRAAIAGDDLAAAGTAFGFALVAEAEAVLVDE